MRVQVPPGVLMARTQLALVAACKAVMAGFDSPAGLYGE